MTLPGGTMNRYSMSVCGVQAIQEMGMVNFDILFLGVTCYSPDVGFTCGVEMEARLKQAVLKRSGQVVVLMDSSKIGRKSTFTICDLSDVDVIISDGNLPQDFLEECKDQDIIVY